MEKCWFSLTQTHYAPPTPESMRAGRPTGPLSLGHIIPSLKHLDQVVNAEGFEPFPPGMQICGPNRMMNFVWSEAKARDVVCAKRGSVGEIENELME